MKIGKLAQATGTLVETIRFYEREGLLPEASRTESNYRIYGDEHTERLRFIRHCRALDMTLEEVRVLLRFKDAPDENCSGVNELLDQHIGHVAERIWELRALEKQLKTLRKRCVDTNTAGSCEILKKLSDPGAPAVAGGGHRHVSGTH